jgi:hypothetical protein
MVNVLANNVKISNVKIVENSENTIICKAVREEFLEFIHLTWVTIKFFVNIQAMML